MNTSFTSPIQNSMLSDDVLARISGGSLWGDITAVGLGIGIAAVTVAGCVGAPETGGATAVGAADLDASMIAELTAALNA